MPLKLHLQPLRLPQISTISLASPSRAVSEITGRNRASAEHGAPESKAIQNAKEKMKRTLIERWERGRNISFEQATSGPGRERILLSLYLDYAGRTDAPWLDPFNEKNAADLLGPDGRRWHAGRRRQVTLLFFRHFNLLPGLAVLCGHLLEAYGVEDFRADGPTRVWNQQRFAIFAPDGPQKLLKVANPRETLAEIVDRFAVPTDPPGGQFQARLHECFLLGRLETAELGGGQEVLPQIESMRAVPYQAGVLLGAAALRIMTRRVLASRGEWKGDWANWILRLGCDPSLPANSEIFAKWWGSWQPTRAEIECAQRAINRQTLEYFIQFLEQSLRGSSGYEQFESRAGFLRWLDDTRKIVRFKLLLHPRAFDVLPRDYRQQRHRVAQTEGASPGTSLIVMECVDDIWIVEGTHVFAARVFRRNFPLPELFSGSRRAYPYASFIQGPMHRDTCTGIWKSHSGDWLNGLLWQMQSEFHVRWSWTGR